MGEPAADLQPLVITATQKFLSSGTDLREIAALDAAEAFTFADLSQELMARSSVSRCGLCRYQGLPPGPALWT